MREWRSSLPDWLPQAGGVVAVPAFQGSLDREAWARLLGEPMVHTSFGAKPCRQEQHDYFELHDYFPPPGLA